MQTSTMLLLVIAFCLSCAEGKTSQSSFLAALHFYIISNNIIHQTIQVEMDFIAVVQPQIAMYFNLSWMISESIRV